MRPGTAARAAMTLTLALGMAACTVPELDLGGKACDPDHPCTAGFVCVDSSCVAGEAGPDAGPAPECAAGDTRPCGVSKGECRQGTESCGGNGRFGACTGAIGPSAETCNGKDDDCDGDVDEELTGSPCEKSEGVCENARHRCVGGVEPACGAAEYGADFEAVETRCDGKDNDCNGKVDEGLDDDHDGYGPAGIACPGAETDCDDHDADAHPGRAEDCDGKDNDCDGDIDTPSFGCARGEVSGTCQACAGTTGQNTCKDDCSAFACVPPPEQCNGRDDNCEGRVDEGLSSGFVTLGGGTETWSPTVAAQAGGGFVAGYVYKSGSSTLAALQEFSPSSALLDTVRITDGTAAISSPALSPLHFAWIETASGNVRVRAVELTPKGSPSEPFTAIDTYPDVSSLAAGTLGSNTILAGVTGAGASLVAATLGGTSVRALNAVTSPTGVTVSQPSFGTTVAGQAVLYYQRTDGTMQTLGSRVLDPDGVPGSAETVFTVPSDVSLGAPSGAPRALAFVQAEGTSNRIEAVMLARMADATGLGTAQLLRLSSPTRRVASPAVAWLRSGDEDVYFVAWLDSDGTSAPIVSTVRVRWDAASSTWGRISTPTGFQQAGRTIQSIGAASDGQRFSVLFDSEASGAFQTVLRTACPAGAP